ncbi:hypothetical protein PZA11_000713 [Diplocarpon coronariae]
MSGRLSRSIWVSVFVLGSLFVFGYLLYQPRNGRALPIKIILDGYGNPNSTAIIPPEERIVVSVKTGASEAAERIPTQRQTCLRDVKHVLFFSDLEQDLGEYHLFDALDTVAKSVTNNNPDFEFYFKQQELWKSTRNLTSLQGAKHPDSPSELAAWTLDKYKNVHMLEKTWALKPDMDWYIFIDADTYLVWPNVRKWLSTLNPNNKYYFGSAVVASGMTFAHGGSGIFLSGASMYELVVKNKGTAAHWDPKTHKKCCGDLILGMALEDCGVILQDVWPLVSGEAPSTMPFGPGTPEYRCRPALSMHHVSPDEMRNFSAYEDRRINKSVGRVVQNKDDKPSNHLVQDILTHTELFKTFVTPSMVSERENWDNLAAEKGEFGKTGGVTSEAASFEDCAHACEVDEKCFQYSHHGRTCNVGMSVRLGYKKEADQEGVWRSGWNLTRLTDWASKRPVCEHLTFPKQDV